MADRTGMKKLGAPSKLTPEVQEKICSAIRAGNYFESSCRYAGISNKTAYEWISRGEGRDSRPLSPEFVAFAEAVRESESICEINLVARIRKAALGEDWKAATWLLERRYSERWANTHRVQLEVRKQLEQTLVELKNRLPATVFDQVNKALIDIVDSTEG